MGEQREPTLRCSALVRRPPRSPRLAVELANVISQHENTDDSSYDLAEDEAECEERRQEPPCPKLLKTQDQPAERSGAKKRKATNRPNPPCRIAGERQPHATREAAESAWAEDDSPPWIGRLAARTGELVHSLLPLNARHNPRRTSVRSGKTTRPSARRRVHAVVKRPVLHD